MGLMPASGHHHPREVPACRGTAHEIAVGVAAKTVRVLLCPGARIPALPAFPDTPPAVLPGAPPAEADLAALAPSRKLRAPTGRTSWSSGATTRPYRATGTASGCWIARTRPFDSRGRAPPTMVLTSLQPPVHIFRTAPSLLRRHR